MKLLSLFIMVLSWQAIAAKECRVVVEEKIIFLKKPYKLSHIDNLVKESNCENGLLWKTFNTLISVNGKISSKQLNRLLKEEGEKSKIKLFPDTVEVLRMKELAEKKINLKDDHKISDIKVIDPLYAFTVKKINQIQFSCHACNTTGEKNLAITYVNPITGFERRFWAQVNIKEGKRVAFAKRDIRPFESSSLENKIEMRTGFFEDGTKYLQEINNLKYFKTNKRIKQNEPIRHSDLSPRTLVEIGKLTEVLINQSGLNIRSEAIAKQSGKLGDFINLYNPKTRRQLRGKVIDFNKVKVDI